MDKNQIKEKIESMSFDLIEKKAEVTKLLVDIKDTKVQALKLYLEDVVIPQINGGKLYISRGPKAVKITSMVLKPVVKIHYGKNKESFGFYSKEIRTLKPGTDNITIPFDFPNIEDYGITKRDLLSLGCITVFDV